MKIKKSELNLIIENYLFNETTIMGLKWPQDFVIFEEEFEQHIANWKLFKRVYPKSAFLLQMVDLSGVSGYGDLAESIETMSKTDNPGIFDTILFWINFVGALPIGLIMALFSGRLDVAATSAVKNYIQTGEKGGMTIMQSIMSASTNYGDLVTEEMMRKFLSDPKTIAAFEKAGINAVNNNADAIVRGIVAFLKIVDSGPFRFFVRTWTILSKNLSHEIQKIILEYIVHSSPNSMSASNLLEKLFKEAPEALSKYIKSLLD